MSGKERLHFVRVATIETAFIQHKIFTVSVYKNIHAYPYRDIHKQTKLGAAF